MCVYARNAAGGLALLISLSLASTASAADPKEIERAIARGATYLKQQAAGDAAGQGGNASGINALIGLALLESGTPSNDKAIEDTAGRVRAASYSETKTYCVALCLIFLDRLGSPADEPLIQVLGVRLLAGQTALGGWGYETVAEVPPDDVNQLKAGFDINKLTGRAGNADAPPKLPARPPGKKAAGLGRAGGRLHPVVERYANHLATTQRRPNGDDNSNTQFGIVGTWVARRHGVRVDDALALVETRFLRTRDVLGGWGYKVDSPATPAMTCAGLLGIATALARRDEKRLTGEVHAQPKPAKPEAAKPEVPPKPLDPFFLPPAAADAPPAIKSPAGKKPIDVRDFSAKKGLALLGAFLNGLGRGRGGPEVDLYLLWSVERVGVVYEVEKIGGIDWYAAGSEYIVRNQAADGSWGYGLGGPTVGAAFALLFLSKSNLTGNLKATKDGDGLEAELRAGEAGVKPPLPTPAPKLSGPIAAEKPKAVVEPLPVPVADEGATYAAELVGTAAAEWPAALARHREAKGSAYTRGLLLAAKRLDGQRKRDVRDALAERLTRMTAATLRDMLQSDQPELRRAAALACAMKEDSSHVPDLVGLLADESDAVWPAAKAALKSLTGQDHGPKATASVPERKKAAEDWRTSLEKGKR